MQSSASKSADAPGAPVSKLSRGRLWAFRLAAMVFVPFVLVGALELGLRVAGFGHPMSFFLPAQVDGKSCRIENPRFGWRFFGPDMARSAFPLVLPKDKAPGTVRIFVFGESAAYGDPQPDYGMSRMLQTLLTARYPGVHFEVVNTGMTAINSHVILPIARDCAAENGDIWVVYMGNNEVVGPYGSGTVFGAQAANLAAVRLGLAVKAMRTGQWLGAVARHFHPPPLVEKEWGGMAMFLKNHVRQNDPRMDVVYANFGRNLEDIVHAGLRSGAKVVVSTVARNLKDCGPFASENRPNLSADDLAHWQIFYDAGTQAEQVGKLPEAVAAFRQAAAIDDTFAEEHFRWGQCCLKLGQDAEALRQFTLACDHDVLRFRADTRINEIIRHASEHREQEGVRLADAVAAVAQQSPHGIAGSEYLYEHVHLNFSGNYLVAKTLADQVAQLLPADAAKKANPGATWASESDCARRLAWTDFSQRTGDTDILSRLNDPPFNTQSTHREQYERLTAEIERLRPALLPEQLKQEEVIAREAVAASPDDWVLQENLALFQQKNGDLTGAAESLRRVVKLLPQSGEAWKALGLALAATGHADEGIAALEHAIPLTADATSAMNSLGEVYAAQGHTAEAAAQFEKVLRLKPYWGPAHLGLGKALEAMGKTDEAKEHFRQALVNRVSTPESFANLGKFSFSKGWYGDAATNFMDSLKLNPLDPEIHVNLGLTLDKLGRTAEAQAHYAEAVRLDPNLAEARFCLGLAMGKSGDSAGAVTQFTEAVRLKPDLMESHLNLAIALYTQKRYPEALEQFNEVLKRSPTNQTALQYVKILQNKK